LKIKYLLNAVRIGVFIVLFNGIFTSFVTYAVVPGKYEKSTYTKEEVEEIVYAERRAGIEVAYETNKFNLILVYGPLAVLLLVGRVLSYSQSRESNA